MPYYRAGDYYHAGALVSRSNYAAGGLFDFLGKAVKSVAKVGGALLTGGPIAAAGAAVRELAPTPAANTPIPILPMPFSAPTPKQSSQGVIATGVSPLGTVGVRFRSGRRMNMGNARAARRAIRRIKGVRHLLQSIERELPHQKPRMHYGSRGVITRAEASRALRS